MRTSASRSLTIPPKGQCTLQYFLETVVPTLPQARFIDPDNAKRWFHQMSDLDSGLLAWHIRRLSGFSASEAGEMAAAARGLPCHFKSVRKIIDEKLLRSLPEVPTRTMRRGVDIEPVARKWFYQDYEARPVAGAVERLNRMASGRYPWMRVKADDIVEMEGGTYLVDYKATDRVPEQSPLVYAAELHQYDYLYALSQGKDVADYLTRESPLSVDGLLNVYFDYEAGTVSAILIPYDPNLLGAILEGGDAVYQHLSVGAPLPEWPVPASGDAIEMDAANQFNLARTEAEWLQYQLLAEAAAQKAAETAQKITQFMRNHSPDPQGMVKGVAFPLQVGASAVKQHLDGVRLEELLNGYAGDAERYAVLTEQLKSPSSVLDIDRLACYLEEKGTSLEEFRTLEFDLDKVVNWADSEGLERPVIETVGLEIDRHREDLEEAIGVFQDQALHLIENVKPYLEVIAEEAEALDPGTGAAPFGSIR